jgi:circadian clock protein KaiC
MRCRILRNKKENILAIFLSLYHVNSINNSKKECKSKNSNSKSVHNSKKNSHKHPPINEKVQNKSPQRKMNTKKNGDKNGTKKNIGRKTNKTYISKGKSNRNKKLKKTKHEKFDRLHIETVNKVDNLIKDMENKKTKSWILPSFLKQIFHFNHSTATPTNTPEFLSTPPFPEYVINWDASEQNLPLLNTENNESNTIIENDTTKMSQINLFNTSITEQSSEDIMEEVKKPLLSEMIEPEEEIPQSGKVRKNKIKWLFTGISGFDDLLVKGIPKGSNIIVAGGPGSGKTIFCLQTIYNKALEGKDCVFLSMEERPERLQNHLLEFGFKIKEIHRDKNEIILKVNGKGRILLKRLQPIKLARSIEALLEKASGTLPIDIDLVLDFFPEDFDVCLLTLDSISAIETAFSGTRRQYRIYIEQLFRYFEHLNITTFMITESTNAPHQFSNTGVEEFLADGIFVFYNFQGVKKRTRGAEIYKLRGAAHSQKIVPMEITSKGIMINPEDVCREQA